MSPAPRVSLAIPLYNEEAVLPELLRRSTAVLDGIPGGPHEIVLVDDGSSDRTWELLEGAAEKDSRLVVVALSRNFGHQTALGGWRFAGPAGSDPNPARFLSSGL
jgi:polyisoprenyl-phosphate glycosyltransferase